MSFIYITDVLMVAKATPEYEEQGAQVWEPESLPWSDTNLL